LTTVIYSFPFQKHAITSLLDDQHSKKTIFHYMATSLLMPKQQTKIKSPIININNCLNKVLPSFDSLNVKLSPGFHLVDTFSNCFPFLSVNCKDIDILKTHHNRLDKVYEDFLNN